MPRRFYAPQLGDQPKLVLSPEESRHLTTVLRAVLGDTVVIFDGRGTEATTRICGECADKVELEVLERRIESHRRPNRVTVATAVPKGERFDWLVEKATELGVDRLIPLTTSRSIVEPGSSKLERLRRTIVEASKQCRRSELMELTPLLTWRQFLAKEIMPGATWMADPTGATWHESAIDTQRDLTFLIGPEGGFTPQEIEQASAAGVKPVSLGANILRIETAALLIAGLAVCGGQHSPAQAAPD